MMSTGVVTTWLVVTNIALGALTVAFCLALVVVAIKETVERRRYHEAIQGSGSGRAFVSESGIISGMHRGDLETISRN